MSYLDVPNSGRAEKTEKEPKGYPPKITNGERQNFDELLRTYIKKLEKSKPVILTGDLNVSHKEIGEWGRCNNCIYVINLRNLYDK